jgi:adenosylmethionine-8-amino-7-oxononanoate aminotransferase
MFRHGITYAGHTAACAAAMANLDILEEERLGERVLELEAPLLQALEPLTGNEHVVAVRGGVGLLAGVQCSDAAVADRVAAHCVANGVMARVIANATLQISPPFVVDTDDIALIADTMQDALSAVPAAA